jgi:hypothetical protein
MNWDMFHISWNHARHESMLVATASEPLFKLEDQPFCSLSVLKEAVPVKCKS